MQEYDILSQSNHLDDILSLFDMKCVYVCVWGGVLILEKHSESATGLWIDKSHKTLISDREIDHVSYVMLKSLCTQSLKHLVIGYCANNLALRIRISAKDFSYIEQGVVVMQH